MLKKKFHLLDFKKNFEIRNNDKQLNFCNVPRSVLILEFFLQNGTYTRENNPKNFSFLK
jgi:hypothetical protein